MDVGKGFKGKAKVRAFMDSRLDSYEEREKFNEWFHTTDLVVVVDPRTKRTEINPAKIVENRIAKIWLANGFFPT